MNGHSSSRRGLVWWLFVVIFAMALEDALLGYLGRAVGIGVLARPWLLLAVLSLPVVLLSLRDLRWVRPLYVILFATMLAGLLLGVLSIKVPTTFGPEGLYSFSMSQIIAMTVAFVIGMIAIVKQEDDGRFLAELLVVLAGLHLIVCLLALWRVSPALFPIIDSPYWRAGRAISRPEITTDQTRQVLYLLPGLCVLFINGTLVRTIFGMVVAAGALYVAFKVQSRGGFALLAVAIPLAMLIGLRYRIQRPKLVIPVVILVAGLVVSQVDVILRVAADVLWRVQQLDGTYGGRLASITYLFEKVGDPAFWLPQGYGDFYSRYGAAPHSFPTMFYLMGGLLSLGAYLLLVGIPLWVLGKRVIQRQATGLQRICFFLGLCAFALQLTQPVVTHAIFWVIAGATVGALRSGAVRRETMVGLDAYSALQRGVESINAQRLSRGAHEKSHI